MKLRREPYNFSEEKPSISKFTITLAVITVAYTIFTLCY